MGNSFRIILIIFVIIAISSAVIIYLNLQSKPRIYEEYPFWNGIEPLERREVLRLMPNWYHEAEFCGYYIAKTQGFYRQKKIDVRILPFNLQYDALDSLRSEAIDFAIVSPPDLVEEGKQKYDLVVIAAIYQIFPGVYLTMENSDITTPADFCGKKIIGKNQTWVNYTQRILQNVEVDTSCVEWDFGEVDISRFLKGEVDIWTGYVQDEPIEVELAGYSVREIYLYDYGFEDYAGLILTRRSLIEDNPGAVKTFLATSLFGWDYALRNPEKAIDAILTYAPDLAIPFQRQAIRRLTPFVKSGNAPIGWIDRNRWERIMYDTGIENPDSLIYDKFLHELYEDDLTYDDQMDQ